MPNNPQSPQKSDITTLITAFSTASGFQKSNRFRINILPPTSIPAGGTQITPKAFNVFASNIQTPSQSIIFYEDTMSPSGPPISIPIRRNYDDRYIIEFIVDKKWDIRSFFDSWINALFLNTGPNKNSTRVQYFTDIVGELEIEALDQNDNVVKTITLYDAYPKQIIPTQFSNDTPNQYLTLIVDMMYRYYTIT